MDVNPVITDYLNLSAKTGSFVSIDVVGSTTLKGGENEQDVIYTFLSYHKLVAEQAYLHHGTVMTISGDGIMCRFERADDAVGAVRDILDGLPEFNKRQNRLATPIHLRLGVHSGQVLESQSMASGQIISQTLDLAAKLQQSSRANVARFSDACVGMMTSQAQALIKVGWDPKLNLNIYEYSLGADSKPPVARQVPIPFRNLIIESDLWEVMKLKRILWARRQEAFTVYEAQQATLALTEWKPHLIFLSTDLSWDAGWTLLKTIRSSSQTSMIPLVAMTRRSTGAAIEQALRGGANSILPKPLDEVQVNKRLLAIMREFYE